MPDQREQPSPPRCFPRKARVYDTALRVNQNDVDLDYVERSKKDKSSLQLTQTWQLRFTTRSPAHKVPIASCIQQSI